MKRKRFSVEQITGILKQAELGTPIADLLRQHGVSEQSYYRWKKLYGGMEPSEARELRMLRDENTKLKKLVADLSLDKVMLQDVLQKSSEARQEARDRELLDGQIRGRQSQGLPVRPAAAVGVFIRKRMDPLIQLRQRVRELAHSRVRFGYRRIYMLQKREGWDVGKDRFYRVYCEENLGLRRKRPWRCIENGSGQRDDRTRFGAWTVSQISSPTDAGYAR